MQLLRVAEWTDQAKLVAVMEWRNNHKIEQANQGRVALQDMLDEMKLELETTKQKWKNLFNMWEFNLSLFINRNNISKMCIQRLYEKDFENVRPFAQS